MKRGLTMIELLMSLGMLTLIMLAVCSWTQATARASATAAEPVRWRSAAEAVMQLVHDDLVTGDFGAETQRVEINNGVLEIHTRGRHAAGAVGAAVHRYRLETEAGEIWLDVGPPGGLREGRLLLTDVATWDCGVGEDGTLTLSIEGDEELRLTRSYAVR